MRDYRKILEDIRRGRIAPVYLLAGEEAYFKEQILQCLEQEVMEDGKDDFNYELFDGDTVSLDIIIESALQMPMFGAQRLVVVKNAPWFSSKSSGKEADALLVNYLQNPSPATCLVFLAAGSLDKRRKLYKELSQKGVVWESDALTGMSLKGFIDSWLSARGKRISPGALELVYTNYQGELALLVLELEKLTLYTGERKEVLPEDIEAVMSFPEQHSIFALTDAVGTKDGGEALWLLRSLLSSGEQPLYVLSMLARQFRLILHGKALAKEGYSQERIAQKMQAHPYAVQKALAQGRYYRKRELIEALAKLLEIDVAIKRGQGEPAALLEQAISELCS